jgi:ABC-type sugar transport system permease subunit
VSIATKRILAAVMPVVLAAVAFVVGDAIVVQKYLGAVQEELVQSTRSLRGTVLNVRADMQRRINAAANTLSSSPTLGPEAVRSALAEHELASARGWVISTHDGAVIAESGETLGGQLGTRSDILFDVSREIGGGSDLAVDAAGVYVKAYGAVGRNESSVEGVPAADGGSDLFLGVVVPAEPMIDAAASDLLSAGAGYAFYAPEESRFGNTGFTDASLQRESRFFDRITAAKATGFQTVRVGNNQQLVAATPVFDFEQWEVLGFVMASRDKAETMAAVRGSRITFWVIGLVAFGIALVGMSRILQLVRTAPPRVFQSSEQRRRIRAQMALLGALVVAPTALGLGWAMVRSNADTAMVMSRPINAATKVGQDLVERLSEGDDESLGATLSLMQQVTGAHYTFLRDDGSRVSTLREERAEFDVGDMDVWSRTDGIRSGVIRINYVIHRVSAIPASELGGELYVTVEDTPYQNSLVSNNAKIVAIIIVMVLMVTVAVWIVSSVHRERTFRLAIAGFLFITPALVILLWWAIGPLLFSVFLTFHRWSIINPAKPFVGFANYVRLFNDRLWWQSVVNTGYYALHIPIAMVVSLAVAMAMNRDMRGITVFRTIYYLPTVNSLVVTALMWKLIFNPEFGLLNYLLSLVGLPGSAWLSHPTTAMPSIMLVTIWFAIGGQMILFLAGLKSIPKTYYEVADIDGTPALAKFWHITLPLLRPTLLFVLITSTIGSFQVFTQVYMLTQGGPAGSTDVAMYRLYTEAWYNLRMGYGATQALTLSVIIFIFTAFQFRFFSREIKYS